MSDDRTAGPPNREAGRTTGERRQLTALFYDLVGSTALLTSRDPEDVRDIQLLLHSEARSVIRHHDGYLADVQGDGGLAYFGYPLPQEDAAEQSVRAALDLVERCRRLGSGNTPLPLKVRIGIATGMAILGGPRRLGERVQDEIVGVAPNLATRLNELADPNTILVAETTYRLTHGLFEFEDLGSHRIKGFPDSLRTWRPLRSIGVEDRFSALRTREIPLFARRGELDLALRRWKRAAAGEGQVLVIEGEAGIGKSRFAAELRERAAGEGATIRVFQCSPRGRREPLHPILDRILRNLQRNGSSAGRLTYEVVRPLFADLGIRDEKASNTLAFLVGAGGPEKDRLACLRPEQVRAEAIEAFCDVIDSWSQSGPQVFVLEDMHWADPSTLDLFAAVTDRIKARAIMLITTTRSAEKLDWIGAAHVSRVTLARLDEVASRELVDWHWKRALAEAPPETLAQFVHQRSDGIPLFVEELTRWLAERRRAGENTQQWASILPREGLETLHDLLATRINSLGPGRPIALAASVIGRKFGTALLRRICAPTYPEAEVELALDSMLTRGLAHQTRLAGAPAMSFRHVLIQEAVAMSLLREERRAFHSRIVDAVQGDPGIAPWMTGSELAEHAEAAVRNEDAVKLLIAAGKDAYARSAIAEARDLLEHALRLIPQLAPECDADRFELETIVALGPVVMSIEGTASSRPRELYERGVMLCRKRPPHEKAEWLPIYWNWWFTAPDFSAQYERSIAFGRDHADVDDPEVRLQAQHCLWALEFNRGEHARCLEAVETGLRLYREDHDHARRTYYGGHDARVCGLGEKAQSLWFLGAEQSALASMEESGRWAEQLGHMGSAAHFLDLEALLHSYRRDAGRLKETAARMADLAHRHELRPLTAKSLIFEGWASALENDPARGRDLIERGFELQRTMYTREDFPIYAGMLADTCGRSGEFEAGLRHVREAIDEAERSGHRFWLPELYRLNAVLLNRVRGPKEEIKAALESALRIAEAQGARMIALRTRVTMAEVEPGAAARADWARECRAIVHAMEPGEEVRLSAARLGLPLPARTSRE